MSAPTPEPLTPDVALTRLRQYGERTSTWSTATYNDGTERALADIARTLSAEVTRLREELADQARAVGYFDQQSRRRRDLADTLRAEVDELAAELRQRPSRAEVLREAEGVVRAHAERVDDAAQRRSWRAAANVLGLRADAVEASTPTPTPLAVSRFDVAMEPAPDEEQVLTIGCIAEDGQPVALLLDPETRRKVHEWTRSGLPPLRAPRNVRVVSTEAGTWRVRWYIRQNRKAKSFSTEEQANAYADGLREKAREMHAARKRGDV